MADITKLTELYNNTSKHSNYQVLAGPLRKVLNSSQLKVVSRYEEERLSWMLDNWNPDGRTMADIGGNTGFFTLEMAHRGAQSVLYIEGNKEHALFVKEAAGVLGLEDRIIVRNTYLNFNQDFPGTVDCCLLLNVLHHIGDDYGDPSISVEAAKAEILRSLQDMSRHARTLIFQLGFNWKGDRNAPLFAHGTKSELIDFITKGTLEDWEIIETGIAVRSEGGVTYLPPDATNIQRQDELGEFLNRPIFLMKSRHF